MTPARSTTVGSNRSTWRRLSSAPPSGRAHLEHRRAVDLLAQEGVLGQASPRAHQRLPSFGIAVDRLQQEHLRTPAGHLGQQQPGRQHPSVVDHHEVARTQQAGEIGHGGVHHRPVAGHRRADQQSGRASGLDRALGDGLLGEPVVVVVHGGAPGARLRPTGEDGWTRRVPRELRHGPHGGRPRMGIRSGPGVGPGSCDPARTQSRVASMGVSPRWAQARGAATRPRVVRINRPCWSR